MARSCGRPGCSEPGAVAYGLAPRLLLAWLAPLGPDAAPDTPVLCRRHADRTSVPAGWTLDDRREPIPRLFRPPPEVAAEPPVERLAPVVAIRPRVEVDAPVLPLDEPVSDDEPSAAPVDGELTAAELPAAEMSDDQPGATGGAADDDLSGLLVARSPLLARAFHGHRRP